MIEQLQYATTTRYNLPQDPGELVLPDTIMKLSLNSMHSAKGGVLQPYGADFLEPFAERPQHNELAKLEARAFSTLITPLKPTRDETPVVGIDVSTIKIGETDAGVIFAVRGAVVWNENRCYRYLRLGPFPFHITEENKREILGGLGQCPSLGLNSRISTLSEAQTQLCNLIERWIQAGVSCSASGSIILWDGSLTAGTPGNPASTVYQILTMSRKNSNSVLAFSKATTIRFLGWRITDLVLKHEPPCLLEVEHLPLSISKTMRLLGNIYVARLTDGRCSFRLDIDRALPREEEITAVEKLLGNEVIFQSYPESLRLAHIYSTFTANDVIGTQRFLTQEYGLRMIAHQNIRRTLFGPYGTGLED